MELDENGEFVPIDGLDYEEIKMKMPPYFFKTPKQKKKFFKKLNAKYFSSMGPDQNKKIKKMNRQVKFQLESTQVKKFSRNQKIA